jgi:hypothetical protein
MNGDGLAMDPWSRARLGPQEIRGEQVHVLVWWRGSCACATPLSVRACLGLARARMPVSSIALAMRDVNV